MRLQISSLLFSLALMTIFGQMSNACEPCQKASLKHVSSSMGQPNLPLFKRRYRPTMTGKSYTKNIGMLPLKPLRRHTLTLIHDNFASTGVKKD